MNQPLTADRIRQLLQGFSRLDLARADLDADYGRLMDIYCVVKLGGVTAQKAAVQRLREQETAALLSEIQALAQQPQAASQVQLLQQEIWELEQSVASRLAHLSGIAAAEEALVRRYLPEIEALLTDRSQT